MIERQRGVEYWKDVKSIIFIPVKWWSIKEWLLLNELRNDSDIVGFRAK